MWNIKKRGAIMVLNEREQITAESWCQPDYAGYVLIQVGLYLSGVHSEGKTAEILNMSISDFKQLMKRVENLY
jgi:hypothetical protein